MKKILLSILIIVIFTVSAYANSGPSMVYSFPSSDVFVVDDNLPIEVDSEHLIIDFSKDLWTADIKVKYIMANPTDEDITVSMAFPYADRIDSFNKDEIAITTDGERVDFEQRAVSLSSNYIDIYDEELYDSFFAFEEIMKSIGQRNESHFKGEDTVYIYNIVYDDNNTEIDVEFKGTDRLVIIKGFNGGGGKDSNGELVRTFHSSGRRNGDELNIITFEEIEFISPDVQITMDTDTLENFFYTQIAELDIDFPVEDLVNLMFGAIHNERILDFQSSEFICIDDIIFSGVLNEKLITLFYDIDFPAKSTQEIVIEYRSRIGYIEKSLTQREYIYQYLLNPAKHWSNFKDLTIEIFTNEELPEISESTLEFNQISNTHYKAVFDTLPDTDLMIKMLYEKEVSAKRVIFNYAPFLIMGVLFLIFLSVIIIKRKSLKYIK